MVHLLLTLFLAGPAHADDALRVRVVDLLSGLESSPTSADWLALGAAAEAELLAIAQDPAALPTVRGNAMVALGNFPSERSRSLLTTTLGDSAANELFRRKACTALAQGWGAGAVPELTRALGDASVPLRQSAARALALVADPAAVAALRERLAVESNASVKAVIEAAVSR